MPNMRDERARKSKDDEAEERARRLAAMQSDAKDLESERQRRIEEVGQMEERQREKDDAQRSERGRFVSGLYRQSEKISLGDNLQRRGITSSGMEA